MAEESHRATAKEGVERNLQTLKYINAIEQATKEGVTPSREDLVFLYGVDRPEGPSGYGGNRKYERYEYSQDPRIAELRATRKKYLQEDMSTVFECSPDKIAHNISEITPDTKAYVGPLGVKGLFKILPPTVEYIYTSFPEGKVSRFETTVGGKDADTLVRELEEQGVKVSDYCKKEVMPKMEMTPTPEQLSFVSLTPEDMGFLEERVTTRQISVRARILGLEPFPDDAGPAICLSQVLPENWRIQQYGRALMVYNGIPMSVYVLRPDGWLTDNGGSPESGWDHDNEWLFRIPNSATEDKRDNQE